MEKCTSPPRPTFQKRNWCLATAFAFFLLLTVYGISIPQKVRFIMASHTSGSFLQIPIKVIISHTTHTTTSTAITLKVTLENTSPTETIYVLKWSSPFDTHAAAVGVFSFTSAQTGETAPGVNMMINHQMPPSGYFTTDDEHILKIEAGGKLEGAVEVQEHEILLEKGKSYDVHARGRWMGVWVGEHEKLGFEEGSDLLIGKFESGKIRLEVPV